MAVGVSGSLLGALASSPVLRWQSEVILECFPNPLALALQTFTPPIPPTSVNANS